MLLTMTVIIWFKQQDKCCDMCLHQYPQNNVEKLGNTRMRQIKRTSSWCGWSCWPVTTTRSAANIDVKASVLSDLAPVVSAASNSLLTWRTSARQSSSSMSSVNTSHTLIDCTRYKIRHMIFVLWFRIKQ